MKKVGMTLTLLAIVCLCGSGAQGVSSAPAVSPAPTVELAGLEPLSMIPRIPECGDYCSTPGAGRGCVDRSGGNPRKVPCTCSGGIWDCYSH